MSLVDDTKRQQRWIMNAQLLCDLIADKKNLVNVIKICDEADVWLKEMTDIFQQEVDPHGNTSDSVLQDYRIEACTAYDEENPGETTWHYNEQSLNRQIIFELGCLSPYAKYISRELECDSTLSVDNSLANPDSKPKDTSQSVIFKMIKLLYLSRRVGIMAKSLPGKTKQDTPQVNKLFQLFINLRRARYSTFSIREGLPPADADYSSVEQYYKGVANKIDRPFNSEHRQRATGRSSSHSDQQLLALHAGASFTTQSAESTLGYIASKIGLPERCDISGTTADIVGAAITWCGGNSEEECQKRAAYVLVCITVMCLMGHHSLAEMATAASLWSKHNYQPFRSNSIWQVISGLCDATGAEPRIDAHRILNFEQSHGWIEGKWRTLKLNKNIPDDIEFNDELWNLMRIMI